MDDVLHLDPRNIIPIHTDLTEEEIGFSQQYIDKFTPQTSELVEIPVIMLHPKTLQNFLVDVVRQYEDYLYQNFVENEPEHDFKEFTKKINGINNNTDLS